jgi:large subunit ribosomal protein L29
MKAKEIREMTTGEIQQRIEDEIHDLQKLRFQHAIAQLENSDILKFKRRDIARMKTILRERSA